jgi:hypothetical protein
LSAVLDALGASLPTATLLAAGLAVIFVSATVASLLYRTQLDRAAHLLGLALGGQAHEARVRARRYGAAMAPLLASLSGQPAPAGSPGRAQDLALAFVCLVPTLALPVYGLAAIRRVPTDQVLPLVVALLVGFAALLSASTIGATVVLHLGVRRSRAIRAACLKAEAQARRGRDGEPVRFDEERGG